MRQMRENFTNTRTPVSLVLLFLLLLVAAITSGAALASLQAEGSSAGPTYQGQNAPHFAPAPPLDTPTSTPTACVPGWNVISSPNVGTGNNDLKSIAVISANNIWAVGHYLDTGGFGRNLIENWDGTSWSIVPSPNVGSDNNDLYEVAAVSANDIWAVGNYRNASLVYQTLAMHWDGVGWSIVASPNVGVDNNDFFGATALATNNVWAVGHYRNASAIFQTLIEHWDGTSWSIVASPNTGTNNNDLFAVAAAAANDIWAVGHYRNTGSIYQTLVEHWNGTAWSITASPSAGTGNNDLNAVTVVAANDVWAVGHYRPGSVVYATLTIHWNGSIWSVVSSPSVGTNSNNFTSVTALATNDVWAVGYYTSTVPANYTTLTGHWNGSAWSIVSSPNSGLGDNQLAGVAAVPGGDVWAVGYAGASTLVERYGICATPPTATTTPVPPTSTQTPTSVPTNTTVPTNTSTSTATPAPLGIVNGHLTWQGIPQPNTRNILTATLTLCSGVTANNFVVTTDQSGNFTATTGLPDGVYTWKTKGRKNLANNGTLTIAGGTSTQEFGLQKAGDANDSNNINSTDFNILKTTYGKSVGQVGYDERADFNNDDTINVSDFNPVKANFGQAGSALTCP